MRLGLISQIKNETDIIIPFLEHIDSLFDSVYLLDHQSIDGSTKLLKQAVSQRNTWKYYYLDFKGHYQKKVANFFLPKIFQENIDYLFFLDADEFINVENRKMLEENLSRIKSNFQVGRLVWINTSPKTFEQTKFSFSTHLLQSPNHSFYSKIVVPKDVFLRDPNITIDAGSHHLRNNNQIIPEFEIGEIIHVPIRSKDQAIKKAVVTGITKAANNVPTPGNYKYAECLKLIAKGELDKQGLIKLIHIYETPKSRYDHQNFIEAYWKNAKATSLEQLNLSKSNTLLLDKPENDTPLHAIIADLLVKQSGNYPLNFNFILEDEVMKVAETDAHKIFEPGKKEQLIIELRKELKTTRGRVNFYKNSKSWKLTKPLRAITTLIRRKKSNQK